MIHETGGLDMAEEHCLLDQRGIIELDDSPSIMLQRLTMTRFRTLFTLLVCASFVASACQPPQASAEPPGLVLPTFLPTATFLPVYTETPAFTPTPQPLVPNFSHIVIITFENKEFGTVVGHPGMPYFNLLAETYTLLTQHYAIMHPSLPNYIAMVSGDTHGIVENCEDCFISAPSLMDYIEQSGRTWKSYQDDMPEPCFIGSTLRYTQKHNPYIYFDSIRLNTERCQRSIVPLTQLDVDTAANSLPNYIAITPDICYSSHDCGVEFTDEWLKEIIEKLYPALEATGEPYLIMITWDEGQGSHSCCGLPELAGGRVATILISPQVKSNFQDATPYSHYSITKTIAEAWGLPYLGHAADAETNLMTAPWK